MATIVITGVAGLVGRALATALAGRDGIDRIVGVDVRVPTGITSPSLVFRQGDVRDPGIAEAFGGADVVVHLAFQFDPLRDEAVMRACNVAGTQTTFEAAAHAGVRQVVYASCVTAYGAHPDNDLPLTEDSPLRGTPGFNYSEHKRDVEAWLWPWLGEHPELDVAVLRPAFVAAAGVQNFVSRLFEHPRLPGVRGHRPPLQFVHVDDVVGALVHAIEQRLTGAYNLSAEGWLSFDEVTAIAGRRRLELPEEVAFTSTDRLWRLGVGDQPPGFVHHLMHPWVMSPQKLISTGWRPRYTNRDALAELVRDHADHIALARLRAERRTVRSTSLALAGLAGLAAVTATRRRRGRER